QRQHGDQQKELAHGFSVPLDFSFSKRSSRYPMVPMPLGTVLYGTRTKTLRVAHSERRKGQNHPKEAIRAAVSMRRREQEVEAVTELPTDRASGSLRP